MSTDLFLFDESFFSFSNPPSSVIEPICDHPNKLHPSDPSLSDILSDVNLFSSPTENQSSSLDTTIQSQSPPTALLSVDRLADMSVLDMLGVNLSEFSAGFDSLLYSIYLNNRSTEEARLAPEILCSQSINRRPGFLSQLCLGVPNSSANSRLIECLRRTCSTEDLQTFSRNQSSSPLTSRNSCIEEASFQVTPYSAEERKERIHRYRCKRTQRNFSKRIKYACRKTLADNRQRVRGRFTRIEEKREISNAPTCHIHEEDKEEIWINGLHGEDEDFTTRRAFVAKSSSPQCQYLGF